MLDDEHRVWHEKEPAALLLAPRGCPGRDVAPCRDKPSSARRFPVAASCCDHAHDHGLVVYQMVRGACQRCREGLCWMLDVLSMFAWLDMAGQL